MSACPCCASPLVRQIRFLDHHPQVSWFCRHCWQDMPTMSQLDSIRQSRHWLELMVRQQLKAELV